MSLTVSFPVMIHLKSTLAITAIMLTGLVAASPFPYASDQEPRKARTVAALVSEVQASPAPMTAWADPPARPQGAVEESAIVANAAISTPAIDETVTATPVVAPTPVRRVSAQAKAEQARRRKIAKAIARERQASTKQSVPAAPTETQVASRTAPTSSQKIDPIGDILRGLGIGKEG